MLISEVMRLVYGKNQKQLQGPETRHGHLVLNTAYMVEETDQYHQLRPLFPALINSLAVKQ